jgi:DNA processing protein
LILQQQRVLQTIDILVLHRIKGIGNKAQLGLIKCYKENHLNSLEDLLHLDLFQKETINGAHTITPSPLLKRPIKLLKDFFANNLYEVTKNKCESDLVEWSSSGIDVLAFDSSKYPIQLKSLDDPPTLLFCKGNLNLLSNPKSIAVVGTRENTKLGEKIACKTVEHYSNLDFCIVSGLALGIDSIAHRTALENNAKTIAVLVDVVNVSPPNNRKLAEQIIKQNGLLISENSPGTKGVPGLFAKRDRIQAGLGMAVFAIETSVNGGTMNAVKAAISIGRDVYVPDAVAARYPDLGIKAISGTQALTSEGKAKPYTRDSYDQISCALDKLVASFEAQSEEKAKFL